MTAIHFQANFLPKINKFRVYLSIGKQQYVELMTKARYLRWARDEKSHLKIGGVTVNFDDETGLKQIKDYFKKVADSYVQTFYKKGENDNN
jgi:hypothetical protein